MDTAARALEPFREPGEIEQGVQASLSRESQARDAIEAGHRSTGDQLDLEPGSGRSVALVVQDTQVARAAVRRAQEAVEAAQVARDALVAHDVLDGGDRCDVAPGHQARDVPPMDALDRLEPPVHGGREVGRRACALATADRPVVEHDRAASALLQQIRRGQAEDPRADDADGASAVVRERRARAHASFASHGIAADLPHRHRITGADRRVIVRWLHGAPRSTIRAVAGAVWRHVETGIALVSPG